MAKKVLEMVKSRAKAKAKAVAGKSVKVSDVPIDVAFDGASRQYANQLMGQFMQGFMEKMQGPTIVTGSDTPRPDPFMIMLQSIMYETLVNQAYLMNLGYSIGAIRPMTEAERQEIRDTIARQQAEENAKRAREAGYKDPFEHDDQGTGEEEQAPAVGEPTEDVPEVR